MTFQLSTRTGAACLLALLLALLSPALLAQVPVDDDGNVIGAYDAQPSAAAAGNEDIPLLSTIDLEELIGPIALYPDDLLAVVLPASVYPLQIVAAARFLEDVKSDPTLKPDPEWDDSVVALLNYPEVVELLNDDIDWTWQLGEAVVAQQADVVAAIETFRDRAYAAGNLKSDSYQNVTHDDGAIQITPVSEEVIYVPYYEPERVVVYQPRPVYYYYPNAYPVYYYPYSSAYFFDRGPFWGVTTAFRIGWYSDSLNVFHQSYYGHPYYGRQYQSRWWYRRPSINIYNTTYVRNNPRVTVNRHYAGDRWRHRQERRHSIDDVRIASNRSFKRQSHQRHTDVERSVSQRPGIGQTRKSAVRTSPRQRAESAPIKFRARTAAPKEKRREAAAQRRATVTFRERNTTGSSAVARNKVRATQRQLEPAPKARATQRKPAARSATRSPVQQEHAVRKTVARNEAVRQQVVRPEQRRQVARAEPRAKTSQRPSQQTTRNVSQRPSQKTTRNVSQRQSEPRQPRGSRSSSSKSPARTDRRN